VDPTLLRDAADLAERGVACALALVVDARGSVPGKPGAAMLVTVDGTSRGTVGGAGLEERVKRLCMDALRAGAGRVETFDLARWKEGGLDSVCGGTVTVAVTLVRAAPHVLLVGGGHCSLALAQVLDVLGHAYTVVDSRPAFASSDRFPRARAVHARTPAAFVREAEELPFTHVYVMGHSHHEDGDALLALLARGFGGTVGVIGSRSKMHGFEERARAAGLSTAGVRSPIGVDIGAESPGEIAVAVAAEIVRDMRYAAPAPAPAPAPGQEAIP
jgi:xanthine dehydrogenase accessory factor